MHGVVMDGEIKSTLGGVALVCAGLFLGLSLVSWHPHDAQVLPNSPVHERASNICGVVGSYVSSYAFATHGLAAFGIAGWLVACGAAVFKGNARAARREIASSAALLVWLSVALQLAGERLGGEVSTMCPLGPGGLSASGRRPPCSAAWAGRGRR